MKVRKCIVCYENRPLSKYLPSRTTEDGLQLRCQECMNVNKEARWERIRLEEKPLFERMQSGDESAIWELFQMYGWMVEYSAWRYSKGDDLLMEELISNGDVAFTKALASYRYELERKQPFGWWFFKYLGMNFGPITKKATIHTKLYIENWQIEKVADVDQGGWKDSDEPIYTAEGDTTSDEALSSDLPSFLDTETAAVARMLAEGFQPGEVKAARGLTEGQYRRKVAVIRNKYTEDEDEGTD